MMANGRRRETRTHAVAQAVLVWSLGDIIDGGIDHYLQFGEIVTKGDGRLPYIPGVEQKMAEIERNGGRLIVEDGNGRS